MKRCSISLFLVLSAFWSFNSGYYGMLMLSLGVASILFVMFLSHRMTVVDDESQPVYLTPKIFRYHLWLAREIFLSSTAVLIQIWRRDQIISPAFKVIKISQQTDMGKVIYANSITLTPGTVAVDIQNDEILVHALDSRDLDTLELGEMDARISLLER